MNMDPKILKIVQAFKPIITVESELEISDDNFVNNKKNLIEISTSL